MAGHHRGQAQPLQPVQAGQPGRNAGMRRGRHARAEHQAADKGHTTAPVHQHQVGGGVAAELVQFELALADTPARAGRRVQPGQAQVAIGQQELGATQPVAAQPVEVGFVGGGLAGHAGPGGGRGQPRHVGKGLVAQEVVRMQVQVQHLHHRLRRGAGDQGPQLLAVPPAGAGVDHHHAGTGGNEAQVDDVAAVGDAEIGVFARHHPDTGRQRAGRQLVVEAGHIGAARLGQRRQRDDQHQPTGQQKMAQQR